MIETWLHIIGPMVIGVAAGLMIYDIAKWTLKRLVFAILNPIYSATKWKRLRGVLRG